MINNKEKIEEIKKKIIFFAENQKKLKSFISKVKEPNIKYTLRLYYSENKKYITALHNKYNHLKGKPFSHSPKNKYLIFTGKIEIPIYHLSLGYAERLSIGYSSIWSKKLILKDSDLNKIAFHYFKLIKIIKKPSDKIQKIQKHIKELEDIKNKEFNKINKKYLEKLKQLEYEYNKERNKIKAERDKEKMSLPEYKTFIYENNNGNIEILKQSTMIDEKIDNYLKNHELTTKRLKKINNIK